MLDEPSIGLHSRDNQRLIDILRQLRDQGNTVLVVEHDADMIRVADHIVDLGLGAGEQGGRVVYSGDLRRGCCRSRARSRRSTCAHELAIPVPATRRRGTGTADPRCNGASEHNLKDVDVEIPLEHADVRDRRQRFGQVHARARRALRGDQAREGRLGSARRRASASSKALEFITDAVLVDQAPIGRTPRSNPVTYLKAFDPIRELFAATKDARARGLTASHFSFNVPGGRCEACQGEGEVRVEMQFLADVFVPCEQCDGKRFKPQVLEVRYKGRTIAPGARPDRARGAHVLQQRRRRSLRRLQVLDEIGLGYLRLGQPATTLSGGEAQRIKIAAHLASHGGERLLYILDEPTTGLHFDDIAKLLAAFRKLLDAGHSLLVIEHNLDVIKTADWIIDLGPEGGEPAARSSRSARPSRSRASRLLHGPASASRVLSDRPTERANAELGLSPLLAAAVSTQADARRRGAISSGRSSCTRARRRRGRHDRRGRGVHRRRAIRRVTRRRGRRRATRRSTVRRDGPTSTSTTASTTW